MRSPGRTRRLVIGGAIGLVTIVSVVVAYRAYGQQGLAVAFGSLWSMCGVR